MPTHHRLATGLRLAARLFLASLVIVSILGAVFGYYGMTTPYKYPVTLNHTDVTFPSQAADGKQLNGWFFPAQSNQVIVIVHGWSGNRARLLPLAEHLNRQGQNVLTFDLRGGTGQNTYGQREAEDLAGAVSWLESQGYPPESIAIVGNSIGGGAAILYAVNHPIRKVVLISPVLDIPTTKRTALQNYRFIVPGLYAFGSSLVERVLFGVHPTNPADVLSDVTTPALLLHGTNDELSPVETVYTAQQSLPTHAPISFQFIPNGSHTFFDDDMEGSQEYTQRIGDFLAN